MEIYIYISICSNHSLPVSYIPYFIEVFLAYDPQSPEVSKASEENPYWNCTGVSMFVSNICRSTNQKS